MDYVSKIQIPGGSTYNITGVIPMGSVASTSTSTVYTATINGITELKNGVCVWLTNGVVNSAADFTININGLGAKPVYRSNAATTRETTRFAKNYTIFLIYNETRVSGGCWDYVYGFDSNTTYTNMSQTEASAGTVTTGRLISAKVLSTTIDEKIQPLENNILFNTNQGVKNIAPNTLSSGTVSWGVTATVNSDGSIVLSGSTPSDHDAVFQLFPNRQFKAGTYKYSGCPAGGGVSRYRIDIVINDTTVHRDIGSGIEFTINADSNIRSQIVVYRANTAPTATFKPMLRQYGDDTYQPYALSNAELTAENEINKNDILSNNTDIYTNYTKTKNKLVNNAVTQTVGEAVFTVNADGSVTAYTTATTTAARSLPLAVTSDNVNVVVGDVFSGIPDTTYDVSIGYGIGASGNNFVIDTTTPTRVIGVAGVVRYANINVRVGVNIPQANAITFRPMICTATDWQKSNEYFPNAMSNVELTKSVEPIPGLVNNGAKNLLPNTATSQTVNGITFTVYPDGTIDAYGTATANASIAIYATDSDIVNKNLVASGCPSGGSATTYRCFVQKLSENTYTTVATMTGDAVDFTLDTAQYRYLITVYNGRVVEHIIFKPMICSKADWNISQKYVPYALPNPELTAATIETVNNGAKNRFCFDSIGSIINPGNYVCSKQFSANGVTFTLNADNTITATRTESSNYDSGCILMYNGRPAIVDSFFDATHMLSGCPAGGAANRYSIGISTEAVGPDSGVYELGDGFFLPSAEESTWDNMFLNIRYSSSYSGTITYKPMICTFHQWRISKEYQPYALPNPELTAATIEAIDGGPKNKLSIGTPTSVPTGLTCVRNDDGTYTVSGTLAAANSISFNIDAIEGDLVLSGCPKGGSNSTYLLRITKSGSQVADSVDSGSGSNVFTMSGTGYALNIRFAAGNYTDVVFKPMICSKAAWGISQEYQPYRPNTVDVVFGPGTEIVGTSEAHQDLNNYTTPGAYFCRSSTNAGYVDNKPLGGSGFRLTVENISFTNTFKQTFIKPTDPSRIYVRHYSLSTWSSWYVFEGTVVT